MDEDDNDDIDDDDEEGDDGDDEDDDCLHPLHLYVHLANTNTAPSPVSSLSSALAQSTRAHVMTSTSSPQVQLVPEPAANLTYRAPGPQWKTPQRTYQRRRPIPDRPTRRVGQTVDSRTCHPGH